MRPAQPSLAVRSAAPSRVARLACLAYGLAVAPGTLGAEAVDPVPAPGGPGCPALARVYRSLDGAEGLPAGERRRLAAQILDTCAVTEIRLVRAETLDGAAVLQLPVRVLPREGRRP